MLPFDDAQIDELKERAKQQLRKRLSGLRRAHPPEARATRSQQIVQRLLGLDAFVGAARVALFWPILQRAEVDLRELDTQLRSAGKRLYYPYLERLAERSVTGFRWVENSDELSDQGSGFLEPHADAERAQRGDLDAIVVPALGVAQTGHRLGYGLGFYDSVLPDFVPPAQTFVVAFDFQLLAELPALSHDFACDWIVTDARVLRAERTV